MRQNYAKTFITTTSTVYDVAGTEEKISWYPYWGAFYWVRLGRLILKIDLGYSTADADVVNPALDPCQTDAPIFKCQGLADADCIKHVRVDIPTFAGSSTNMVDHVWVFKFMYMIITGSKDYYIYKVSGNPRATGATGTLAINTYITT